MGKTARRPKYPQHYNSSQLLKQAPYRCEVFIFRVPLTSASQQAANSLSCCPRFRAQYDFVLDFVVRFTFKGYISGQE